MFLVLLFLHFLCKLKIFCDSGYVTNQIFIDSCISFIFHLILTCNIRFENDLKVQWYNNFADLTHTFEMVKF